MRSVSRIAASAQALTILFTWHLWQRRDEFPNLAVVESFDVISFGPLLIIGALFSIAFPRVGSAVFTISITAAIFGDEVRLQPEVISLTAFMLLSWAKDNAVLVGRWLLASLWIWSGLHKVLSTGWHDQGGQYVASLLHLPALDSLLTLAVPALELAAGVAALATGLRPVARVLGPLVHLGILFALLISVENSAVWPWNAALALIALLLFAPSEMPPLTKPLIAFVAALLVFPASFYWGANAYLTYNLYSFNTAIAEVCGEDGQCKNVNTLSFNALNVPVPPEEKLFVRWFGESCESGQTLKVTPQPSALSGRTSPRELQCPRD